MENLLSEKNAARDNKIMKLLGTAELRHLIAHTTKGELTLSIRKGETAQNYRFVLDSVPLEDDHNDELKELYKVS